MNAQSFILLLVVLMLGGMALYKHIRDRRHGGGCHGCDGCCGCDGSCPR